MPATRTKREAPATEERPLHSWRCANPSCPSRRSGKPGQIVMQGGRYPGWYGVGRCHQCRNFTKVEIDERGRPRYEVWSPLGRAGA